MIIAEICLGGSIESSYRIINVKRVETSIDGVFCKITTDEGRVYETSPHNVLLITEPEMKGGE